MIQRSIRFAPSLYAAIGLAVASVLAHGANAVEPGNKPKLMKLLSSRRISATSSGLFGWPGPTGAVKVNTEGMAISPAVDLHSV